MTTRRSTGVRGGAGALPYLAKAGMLRVFKLFCYWVHGLTILRVEQGQAVFWTGNLEQNVKKKKRT